MENLSTMSNVITLIITNLITNIILFDFFSVRYALSRDKEKTNIVFSISATVIAVLINGLHNPHLNLILYILFFIFLNLLFHIKRKKEIVINITFFIVIFLLMDTVCYFIVELSIKVCGVNVSNIFVINVKMLLASLMQFTIYSLLKNFLFSKKINQLKKKDLISYILISSLSILFAEFSVMLADKESQNLKTFFFIAIICISILNIYYIKLVEYLSKSYDLEIALENFEKNSKMMFNHYQTLEDKDKNTRLVLHDIRNHLQTLEALIQNEDGQEKKYLNTINERVVELSPNYIINRKILNILFSEKIDLAKKHNIKIEYHVDDITLDFIDDFDLVTIFSNILDNAIEAVKDLHNEDKLIKLYIKKMKNFILVKECNICVNELVLRKDGYTTTKKGHTGLGLKSIEVMLEKYNANMFVQIDENHIFNNIILFSL